MARIAKPRRGLMQEIARSFKELLDKIFTVQEIELPSVTFPFLFRSVHPTLLFSAVM
jgi:hypothetical protein